MASMLLYLVWCLSIFGAILNVLHFGMVSGHGGNHANDDIHGGVEMGIVNPVCDDAKWKLEVDWDNSTDFEYTCQPNEDIIPDSEPEPKISCIPKREMPKPLHKCMTHKITYTDQPPRAGPHRPLWPKYGEYLYVPPQRWIHSLEHGGVVFLYHPCANPTHVEDFKDIAKNCLWKHIITPYRNLKTPFAVLTYGCRITMNAVDRNAIVGYARKYGLKGPEGTFKDGQYDLALLEPSKIVSDFKDSIVCPRPQQVEDNSNPAPDNDLDIDSIIGFE